MNILKKIKTRYEEWKYNNWVNSLNEKELTAHYIDIGFWDIDQNDKTRYNRTDFESHEGLNIKRLCRKLDIMNGEKP